MAFSDRSNKKVWKLDFPAVSRAPSTESRSNGVRKRHLRPRHLPTALGYHCSTSDYQETFSIGLKSGADVLVVRWLRPFFFYTPKHIAMARNGLYLPYVTSSLVVRNDSGHYEKGVPCDNLLVSNGYGTMRIGLVSVHKSSINRHWFPFCRRCNHFDDTDIWLTTAVLYRFIGTFW